MNCKQAEREIGATIPAIGESHADKVTRALRSEGHIKSGGHGLHSLRPGSDLSPYEAGTMLLAICGCKEAVRATRAFEQYVPLRAKGDAPASAPASARGWRSAGEAVRDILAKGGNGVLSLTIVRSWPEVIAEFDGGKIHFGSTATLTMPAEAITLPRAWLRRFAQRVATPAAEIAAAAAKGLPDALGEAA